MGDLIDAELQDHPTGKELVEDAKQSTMDKRTVAADRMLVF